VAWTQADIDTLKAAIATGTRRVRFGAGPDSRETEFRSLAEMRSTLAMIEAEVSGAGATPRVSYIEHCRG
jgi:hypothetical protein